MTTNGGITGASVMFMFFVDLIVVRLPWHSASALIVTMLSVNALLIVLTILRMKHRQRKGTLGS